jgi:hypothetical protein
MTTEVVALEKDIIVEVIIENIVERELHHC